MSRYQSRRAISIHASTDARLDKLAQFGARSKSSVVESLVNDALNLPADQLAELVARARVNRIAAADRSARNATQLCFVTVSADLFDRIKLIAETFPTTKPAVLDAAITAALDAADAEQRCQWYGDGCDQRSTHVVHEPAEYDEDGRDIVEPARDRRLCGRHARGYDRQHAAVRKCQPITAAANAAGVAA